MDRELGVELVSEDLSEMLGMLGADDRRTCYTCKAWATEEHVQSAGHWRAVERAAYRFERGL